MSSRPSMSVDTIAALKALSEADGAAVWVRGYHAIADGGGGQYVFDGNSSESEDGGTVVAPTAGSGRWHLVHDGVLSVEQFGAGGARSAVENTRAFKNAVSASPQMLYFRNVTYNVFSSIDDVCLFDLIGKNGMTFDGRGATLSVACTFTGTDRVFVFRMRGSSNITIRNFNLIGPEEHSSVRSDRGMCGVWLKSASKNIVVQNIRQTSGIVGVGCGRKPDVEPLTKTCKRLVVENYETIGVAYPLNFRYSGDNVRVRNFRALRCSRAYFPYGVRDHDVEITVADPDTSPMINLAAQAKTAESGFLEDIRCSVTVEEGDANIESEWVGLTLRTFTGSTHPVVVRNIRINISGVMGQPDKRIFTIDKQFDGAPDSVDRGHIIQDVQVSGNVVFKVRGHGPPIQAMDPSNQGLWGPGEHVRNLRFRNLHITHPGVREPAACRIGVNSIKDLLVVENCDIPNDLVLRGILQMGTRYVNSAIGSSFYVDVVNSVQSLDGSRGNKVISPNYLLTELRPPDRKTFTLPDGKEGQEKQLVLVDDTGTGRAKVRPGKLRGFRHMNFNTAGNAVTLKFTDGEWTVLHNQGCRLV